MAKRTNRGAWGLVGVMAVVVLGGGWLLFVRLKPYWRARYYGRGADLHGTVLAGAQLTGVDLIGANLRGADLQNASLTYAYLWRVDLRAADLTGADLTNAWLCWADLGHADLRRANLSNAVLYGSTIRGSIPIGLTGARYDASTRWPDNFDPQRHGAVLVK